MTVKIDLHNHSCLSPCGSDDLTPALLAVEAMEQGIQILALTDHNSARNLPAFAEACELCEIFPLFGIEVNTIEDVHVLVLFAKLEDAMEFGSFIEFLLPPINNDPHLFGNQHIVNLEGEVTGKVEKLLISTSGISFNDVIEEGLSRDALVIPAHIDRSANSALSNLGFLPDLPYSALEAIRLPVASDTHGKTILTGSDAHYLQHVGRRACYLEMEELSYSGLKQALESGKVTYRR
ncbi:PHP domain-containing protein [uncultured Sphaerochaeta sp.]|uniref:PHP domain-containing protein n=1 Tax=uncultured Sphaerochaeta sp. TaxID=886478 RepID=UPI002A0A1070|nr:PHP domain-containing protein [uncultured Sphaerochaeta sp.]